MNISPHLSHVLNTRLIVYQRACTFDYSVEPIVFDRLGQAVMYRVPVGAHRVSDVLRAVAEPGEGLPVGGLGQVGATAFGGSGVVDRAAEDVLSRLGNLLCTREAGHESVSRSSLVT